MKDSAYSAQVTTTMRGISSLVGKFCFLDEFMQLCFRSRIRAKKVTVTTKS